MRNMVKCNKKVSCGDCPECRHGVAHNEDTYCNGIGCTGSNCLPVQEAKTVRLMDNPFLLSLTTKGSTYEDVSPDKTITVVAIEGDYGDWAAYFETPWTPFGNVAEYGNKLPLDAAKQLFPDFAKRLKWRP